MLLGTLAAHADVGPPPSCPSGQHDEYWMGHHCVPDDSHLEHDPNGGVQIVKNGEVATPQRTLPTPAPTDAGSTPPKTSDAPPSAEPAPGPAPAPDAAAAPAGGVEPTKDAEPPAEGAAAAKGCGCDASGSGGGLGVLLLALALTRRR